jgi:hypothetical protein
MLSCTVSTPTLSEADPETETVPETVLLEAGAEMETEGGVVSGGGGGGGGGGDVAAGLLNVTVSVVTAVLPRLSVAWAATVCVPSGYDAVLSRKFQELVPDAGMYAPPSTLTFTLASVVLLAEAEAEPETVTGPDVVEPDEGEAIETVGFVGLPLPLPLGAATATAANMRRKKSVSVAVGRCPDRRWWDGLRRESMAAFLEVSPCEGTRRLARLAALSSPGTSSEVERDRALQ